MATTSTTGSTLLQPLSNAVQLPIDQVNFVVCQLFALLAAVWFRTYLHSSKTSSFIRHVVATLMGLYLAFFLLWMVCLTLSCTKWDFLLHHDHSRSGEHAAPNDDHYAEDH